MTAEREVDQVPRPTRRAGVCVAMLLTALVAACTAGEHAAGPTVHPSAPATTGPTSAAPTATAPTSTPTPTPTKTTPTATATTTVTPTTSAPADVVPDRLERDDSGEAVRALQEELSALGYWLGTPDGRFGHLTEQAVLALQGAAGIARDGIVGPRTRQALDAAVRPSPRSNDGEVVEVDRDAGLLLFAQQGKVDLVLHTSTGTFQPYTVDGRRLLADTPAGTWQVSWAFDGWRRSDLGRLYRPRYFHHDGIAVHGYPSVPAHPASHGCARVSMAAMDKIWRDDLMPLGTTVLVY